MLQQTRQNLGINPVLLNLVTGQDLSEIPSNPPVSMLPGNYSRAVVDGICKISPLFPENKHRLTCTNCGHTDKYDLGSVLINGDTLKGALKKNKGSTAVEPEAATWFKHIQATGYFRCVKCNSAGVWELPARGNFGFTAGVMGAILLRGSNRTAAKFSMGVLQLVDGSRHRWSTDTEEYYLTKLAKHPEDAFLWNRLGNSYHKGGRPDLAAVAFEQSLKVDPEQLESHYTLGNILLELGLEREALSHLRQVLIVARKYKQVTADKLRDLLAETLYHLVMLAGDGEQFLSFLPTGAELFPGESLPSGTTIMFTEISIDPANPSSLLPLAEQFMGERRRELKSPTLKLPEATALTKLPGSASRPGAKKTKKSKKKTGGKKGR